MTNLGVELELNVRILICQFGAPGFIRMSNNLCKVTNQEDIKFMLKIREIAHSLDKQLLSVP